MTVAGKTCRLVVCCSPLLSTCLLVIKVSCGRSLQLHFFSVIDWSVWAPDTPLWACSAAAAWTQQHGKLPDPTDIAVAVVFDCMSRHFRHYLSLRLSTIYERHAVCHYGTFWPLLLSGVTRLDSGSWPKLHAICWACTSRSLTKQIYVWQ